MDDRSKRGREDAERINVNEDYELAYWSEKFACSAEALRNAVAEVGVMAKDVEAYLASR